MYNFLILSAILLLNSLTTKSLEFPKGEGTIELVAKFDPTKDARILRSAMKGFGTEESTILDILTRRTYAQRKQIEKQYKRAFKRGLVSDLASEMGGDILQVLTKLLMDPLQYMAIELHDAMEGWGTTEATITEILCTHTRRENLKIAELFNAKYNKSLSSVLTSELSGNYGKLIQNLIAVKSNYTNANIRNLSRALVPKIEKRRWLFITTQTTVREPQRFIDILGSVSLHQLKLIMGDFFEIGRQTLRHTIMTETGGDFRSGLIALVDSAENRPLFFAKRLYRSMDRPGTDDKALIRIIVTRAEWDMKNIKYEFRKAFNVSLPRMVAEETSGVYRKALLILIGGMTTNNEYPE